MKKRILSLLLALGCVLSLSVPAFAADVQTVHAEMRSPRVYIENVEAGFLDSQGGRRESLLYNGTVYIPLRTAGLWMGARVDWNQETMTVAFTSTGEVPAYYSRFDFNDMNVKRLEGGEQYRADMTNGVDVELRPDITVTVDGQVRQFANVLGQPVYPMLFRECIYLPARSIGELCGKKVLWFAYSFSGAAQSSSHVHIYDFPTAEQLTEANAYFSAIRGYTEELRNIAQAWTQEENVTEEQITEKVTALQKPLQAILDLPIPSFQGMMTYVEAIQNHTNLVLSESLLPYSDPKRVSTYYKAATPAQRRDNIVHFLLEGETYFTQLESWCNICGDFITAVAKT